MTAELPRQAQPDLDAKAAALRGASLAFGNGKPVVKPKPETHNYSGKNGALAAATLSAAHGGQSNGFGNSGGNLEGRSGKVNGGGKPLSMQELLQGEKDAARLRGMEESSRIRRQNTGSSVQSERVGDMGGGRGAGRGTAQLRVSEYSFGTNDGGGGGEKGSKFLRPDQSRSTSFIAANLAASRSASVSPNPTGPSKQPMSRAEMRIPPRYGSRSPSVRSGDSSRASLDQALDTRPIPPTGSLIGIFEQNGGQSEPGKPLRRFNTSASIQPHARVSHSASVTPMRVRSPSPLSNRPLKAPPELKPPKPTMPEPQPQAPPMSGASALSTPKAKPSPPARKPSIHSKPIEIPSKSPASTATSQVTATPKDDDAASDDSFVSASDYSYKPSWRAELASQNRRLTSPSIASGASSVTVDSLANAIVASSLASSRGASPSKSLLQNTTGGLYPPTPPPRRAKYHHHTHLFHNGKELSRTPSPNKNGNGVGGGGMLRTTMRKVKSKEEIDEGEKGRGRKNLVKKHPNKHHEGDRKRWRDSITERERKRYEAVWASNRGLYTTMSPSTSSTSLPNTNTDPNSLTNFKANSNPEGLPIDPPNEVLNLVVRDIFSRSRLHNDVLEEVYALVDRRGVGSLGKEEFVVGLWLIDQRLKGRKLPIRVSESVWRSVGVLGGIKVKKIKH